MDTFEVATRLRQEFEPARRRLEHSLMSFTDAQMIAPLLEGGWSVKDVLAHIAFWDNRLVYAVYPPADALNPLAPPAVEDIPYGPDWADAVNARIYHLNRSRGLVEVRSEFEQAYARLFEVVSGLSDHEILDADGLTARWGFPAMEMFAGIREHYEEHAVTLEAALKTL